MDGRSQSARGLGESGYVDGSGAVARSSVGTREDVRGGKSYSLFAFGLLDGKDAAMFKVSPNEDKIVKGSMGYK